MCSEDLRTPAFGERLARIRSGLASRISWTSTV
jgi:hypothetical protein